MTIVSLSWLRGAKAERLLHEVTEAGNGKRPAWSAGPEPC